VVLGAPKRLCPLSRCGCSGVDGTSDGRRSDEAHRVDPRVLEERTDDVAIAVEDVEDAIRQSGLLEIAGASSAADGSFSEGFKIIALPQARAFAVIHSGTMAGKLNGVIAATTPTGWRTECTSTPLETCEENPPLRWLASPHAKLEFSRPREISPRASLWTLPCSAVIAEAISSLRALRGAGTRTSPRSEMRSTRCPRC